MRPHATKWTWNEFANLRKVLLVGACPRSQLASFARMIAKTSEPDVVDWNPRIREWVVLIRAPRVEVQLTWARPNYSLHGFDPEWADEKQLLKDVDGIIFVGINPPEGSEITLAAFGEFRVAYELHRKDYCPLLVHWQRKPVGEELELSEGLLWLGKGLDSRGGESQIFDTFLHLMRAISV